MVDFGHAKQIFEDADVFPSIIVARKPTEAAEADDGAALHDSARATPHRRSKPAD